MSKEIVVVAAVAIATIVVLVLLSSGQKTFTGQAFVTCLLDNGKEDIFQTIYCQSPNSWQCCEEYAISVGLNLGGIQHDEEKS